MSEWMPTAGWFFRIGEGPSGETLVTEGLLFMLPSGVGILPRSPLPIEGAGILPVTIGAGKSPIM